jgi:hypothetical protein
MAAVTEVQGDYALRGRDYETELLGAITDTVIDADRLARLDHRNGMPNFAIYRLVLAQDRLYLLPVRQWWVMFSLEWCRTHMRSGYSEELATVAAWDSLQRVMDPARPLLPAAEAAESRGVELETYTRARNTLRQVLSATLDGYWALLCGTYRVAAYLERKA